MSEIGRVALALDDRAQLCCYVSDSRRIVGCDVRNSETAAQVEFGQLDAVLVADLAQQSDNPMRRHLEPGGVEDLRADVRVQPDQLEYVGLEHPASGFFRVSPGK